MQPVDTQDLIALWQAQEQAMRGRLAGPGTLTFAQVSALSPKEFFDGIGNGELPSPPIGTLMDFVPIELGAGVVHLPGHAR